MSLRARLRADLHQPVGGNRVELLAGGPEFYAAIERAIDQARHEVLLCTYLWESDATGLRFLDAAGRAAERGLDVAVLVDGVGGRLLQAADLERLRRRGGQAAVYHPLHLTSLDSRLFRRLHRKLLVVDGRLAFVGGAGFADAWMATPPWEWWDVMLQVEGPVVPALRAIFVRDWKRTTRTGLGAPGTATAPPAGDERVQPLVSRPGRAELGRRLRGVVHGARRRVDIANAYFVPGFRLRRSLRRVARRGVPVRLLLPGQRNDHFAVWSAGRRHYHRLLAAGVRIHEWQRGMLHAKLAVVDDDWAYVGSSNLDRWSAHFNLELDLALLGPGGVSAVAERFETDLACAREITLSQWEARPFSLRLFEQVFGWFDPLL